MELGEIDALIDSIYVMGPAALPFALGVYNVEHVLNQLKAEKARRTQAEAQRRADDAAVRGIGGVDALAGLAGALGGQGGARSAAEAWQGYRASLGQSGGAVEIEPEPEEETKEPDVRETVIDIEPPSSIGRPGMRQRGGGGEDRGDLRDVDINPPDEEVDLEKGEADNNDKFRVRRLPRPGRKGVGIAGAGVASVIQIIRGLYPNATIKSRPDGKVEVTEPDGSKKIIDPKAGDIPRQPPSSAGVGVKGLGVEGGVPPPMGDLNLKGKFRNPRRGRHNYILFEAYSDNASKSTGAGAPNVIKPSLKI